MLSDTGRVVIAGMFICVVAALIWLGVEMRLWQKEVSDILVPFAPGTPFTNVVSRLGVPTQSLTNAEDMEFYTRSRQLPSIVTNSVLHLFAPHGARRQWVFIYTDRDLQKVVYAECRGLRR
jgi:hypothetical protein